MSVLTTSVLAAALVLSQSAPVLTTPATLPAIAQLPANPQAPKSPANPRRPLWRFREWFNEIF